WVDSADAPAIAYLNAPERRNASIEICSFDSRLRAHLDRACVSRYASLHPLGFRVDSTNPVSFTQYQKIWRAAYLDTLRARKPEYLIIHRGTGAEYLHDPYDDVLKNIEGFDSLFQNNYHLDTTIGRNEIYGRQPK